MMAVFTVTAALPISPADRMDDTGLGDAVDSRAVCEAASEVLELA
jgi:hypothetical protein